MRVALAMSGGVDSSLAAFLLQQAGHEVWGLTLRLGTGPDQAPAAAARAAEQLGLAHEVVDVAGPFNRQVLGPSLRSRRQGRTPNPCCWCNARVKFPRLWQRARELGCTALASGHYARLAFKGRRTLLREGADPGKSQAYFLARLAPELLARLCFPLGELAKGRVRRLARQAGLLAAQRPESQDGCFLPAGGLDQLMAREGLVLPGVIEDLAGRELGRHQGLHRFTVGQRRGLGLSQGRPLYVVALEGERGAVKVGGRDDLWARGLWGQKARWFLAPRAGAELKVRLRSSSRPAACRVWPQGERVKVSFSRAQRAVAPGQLAVFYHGDLVAGSAWIETAINER